MTLPHTQNVIVTTMSTETTAAVAMLITNGHGDEDGKDA